MNKAYKEAQKLLFDIDIKKYSVLINILDKNLSIFYTLSKCISKQSTWYQR